MNKGEKILWHAVNQIVSDSEDNEPPFRAAPREVLIELARKAIEKYRHLTNQSSERELADVICKRCKGPMDTTLCCRCKQHIV